MSLENVPSSLAAIAKYLKLAKKVEKVEPIMAHFCRNYAVQVGINERAKTNDEDSKKYLYQLLDVLEKDKEELIEKLNGLNKEEYTLSFALKVFKRADDEDRQEMATKATASAFYDAALFLDVFKQFGTLDEETLKMQKYAKWKAMQINKAIQSGEKPGGNNTSDLDLENELNNYKGSQINQNNFSKGNEKTEDDVPLPTIIQDDMTDSSIPNSFINETRNVPTQKNLNTHQNGSFNQPPYNPQNVSHNQPPYSPQNGSHNQPPYNPQNVSHNQPPYNPQNGSFNQPTFNQPPYNPQNGSFNQPPYNPQNGSSNQFSHNQPPPYTSSPKISNNPPHTNQNDSDDDSDDKTASSNNVFKTLQKPQPLTKKGNHKRYNVDPSSYQEAQRYAKFVLSSLLFEDVNAAVENVYLCLEYLTGIDHKRLEK
jgi:hypothetical protein